MKKGISLFFAAVMLAAMFPAAVFGESTAPFTDMDGTEYYAEAAKELWNKKVISGYEDGSFGAERKVTRAEMAAFVCRFTGAEETAERKMGKTTDLTMDVPADHWASGYVTLAVERSIINGDGDGNFRPGDNVRFEEAVKMVICASGLDENVSHLSGDWAWGYIKEAETYGILNSVKCGEGEYISRGDVALMIYQAMGYNEWYQLTFDNEDLYYKTSSYDPINLNTGDFRRFEDLISLEAKPQVGYKFKEWVSSGDVEFADPYSPITEFYMPAHDAVIDIVFEELGEGEEQETYEDYHANDAEDPHYAWDDYEHYDEDGNEIKYHLEMTMTGCGGIRNISGEYPPGMTVVLYIAPGTESAFIRWTATAGTLHTPENTFTVFTMPDEDVVVCAEFTP